MKKSWIIRVFWGVSFAEGAGIPRYGSDGLKAINLCHTQAI